jgi:hypothetical protein
MKFKRNPHKLSDEDKKSKWIKELPYELIPLANITWSDKETLIGLFRFFKKRLNEISGFDMTGLKMKIAGYHGSLLGLYKESLITLYDGATVEVLMHEMIHYVLREERQRGIMHSDRFFKVLNALMGIALENQEIHDLYYEQFNKSKYIDIPDEARIGDYVELGELKIGKGRLRGEVIKPKTAFVVEKYWKQNVRLYSVRTQDAEFLYNLQFGRHFYPK